MEKFVITGGKPLHGEVTISGAKNAAVGILPATILAADVCVIENLPDIEDVRALVDILRELGAEVDYRPGQRMVVNAANVKEYHVPYRQTRRLRASYYLLGALLGRGGRAEVAYPGGCNIGSRPIDQHLKGFETLGAAIEDRGGVVYAKADHLVGNDVFFDMVTVGGTINVLLAAARAEGTTVIYNAAKEPHLVDLAPFLNSMGAKIRAAGTDVIRVRGVQNLHGTTYTVIPDQIETGTLMIAAAATRGDVIINNVIPTHLEAISAKLMECGVTVTEGDDGRDFFIRVSADKRPRAVNIKTLPYPGFPTDLQQPMMAYLTRAKGNSFIVENIFENRFNHVGELQRMGANIVINDRTAMVEGVEKLFGAPLYASDLRAGAALIVAALSAEGRSEIHNIEYIDRGYEYFEQKLRALGADITRVEE